MCLSVQASVFFSLCYSVKHFVWMEWNDNLARLSLKLTLMCLVCFTTLCVFLVKIIFYWHFSLFTSYIIQQFSSEELFKKKKTWPVVHMFQFQYWDRTFEYFLFMKTQTWLCLHLYHWVCSFLLVFLAQTTVPPGIATSQVSLHFINDRYP